MFIDARSIAAGEQLETDVCIIGAGAVGITLANEWDGAQFRVALLESGGLGEDADTQALYKGSNIGHGYYPLDTVRFRYFGGSTNRWGGHCLPIRAMNFEKRDWIPYSGWPITRQQLDPFYRRAHKVIGLGPFDYDPARFAKATGGNFFPFDPARVDTVVSRYHALRFGKQYREPLGASPNVTTYLYANALSINRERHGNMVRDLSIGTLHGNRFRIRAKQFVLAGGGIENPRLLLLSNDVEPAGLGNRHDAVGRFFMEHIWYPNGYILPANQRMHYRLYTGLTHVSEQVNMAAHLSLPEPVVRREKIPDYRAEIGLEHDPKHALVDPMDTAQQARNDLPGTDLEPGVRALAEVFASSPERSEPVAWPIKYRLGNFSEQIPNPDSRVTLSGEKDALGLRRAQLDWRLTEFDKYGVRRAQELIALEVGRSGFGRLRSELKEDEEVLLAGARGGAHHMGTTRMGDDPRNSVVDSDCKVHGMNNLYIGGSSVFPTGGFANPTLTIVALTLRLADHIRTRYFA